jgi:hypothetical protein
MWKCENVEMWKCENLKMWKCENLKMWKCENQKNQLNQLNLRSIIIKKFKNDFQNKNKFIKTP